MSDSFVDVEISSLPVVPVNEAALLPRDPGLYFLLAAAKQVLYIGESGNIRQRVGCGSHRALWMAKHNYQAKEIAFLTSQAYPDLADKEFRQGIEKQLIYLFWPICNYELQTVRRIPAEIHKLYIEEKIRAFS